MKIETTYICEICGQKYQLEADAIKCEQRGARQAEKFPIGLLHYQDWGNGRYGIFCVGAHHMIVGHSIDLGFWACRSWSSFIEGGDNFGSDYCSGHPPEDSGIKYEHLDLPPMKRMLSYLEGQGIEPTVRYNGVIISLNKYLQDEKDNGIQAP